MTFPGNQADSFSAPIVSSTLTSAPAPEGRDLPWHLGARHLDVAAVWPDYTGKGVRIGVFDDGVQAAGTSLAAAVSSFSDRSSGYQGVHGTAVAGLIAAQPDEADALSPAPVGVAYGATLLVTDIVDVSLARATVIEASAAQYDVVNNSWGWTQAFYANRATSGFSGFFCNLVAAADSGRAGLGTSQVVASGNGRATGGDANLSNLTNDRHVITVAATTSDHTVASYSNGGASVLVAAASSGGALNVITTDVAGADGYSSTDVTTAFGGTSAAAPQASGVVALMLEANPGLGWRDVRDILAYSARQIDGTQVVVNGAHDWNAGGLRFSNDTGFGEIDARAAVRLAETWTAVSTSSNEQHLRASVAKFQALSDFGSISYALTLAPGTSLENVQLTLAGQHGRVSDLTIELVSPAGTLATLLASKGSATTAYGTWTFGANTFLGEDSGGTWTVRIRDTAAKMTGLFTGVTLDAYGAAAAVDTAYIFTDAFADLAADARMPRLDLDSHDTINAAAVSSASRLDLDAGAQSLIGGRAVTLGSAMRITAAYGGDGDDIIIGNDLGNLLQGGRGNDWLVAGAGDNRLDGGSGFDVAVLQGARETWSLSRQQDGSTLAVNLQTQARTVLASIERIDFTGDTIDVGPVGQAALPAPGGTILTG